MSYLIVLTAMYATMENTYKNQYKASRFLLCSVVKLDIWQTQQKKLGKNREHLQWLSLAN